MKKKSLLLILVALVCLFVLGLSQVNAAEQTASLSFASTDNRVINTEGKLHTWTQNGITVLHEQGSSTSKVNADYYNPVRFYAGHKVTIKYDKDFSKVILNCNTGKPTSDFSSSTVENATFTIDSTTVITITLNAPAKELVISKFGAQLRVNSIDVVYDAESSGGSEGGETPIVTPAEQINNLVDGYYGNGNYTKKSEIFVTQGVTEYDLESVFTGQVRLNRTTYYTKNALLMTELDGNVTEGAYNSGYGTAEDGTLTHFTVDSNGNKVDEKFSADKTHKNWDDTTKDGMEGFYTTLDDMLVENYFEGWTYDEASNVATFNVTSNDSVFVKDFLAFVAPCLEPVVLGEEYANYFGFDSLEITTGKHDFYGDYLQLRIYLNADCSNYVENDELVLAEARIYKGNSIFNELENPTTETTISDLVKNKPTKEKDMLYIVEGIWKLDSANANATTYGNGFLLDDEGNKIVLYGLSATNKCLSVSNGLYVYTNSKDYSSLNLKDYTIVKVAMVYTPSFDNYSAYLIEVVCDVNDEQAVKLAAAELALVNSTKEDLDLPSTGILNTSISWESDNENVISNSGIVTRPSAGSEDATVTLTATITKGDVKITKDFTVLVIAEVGSQQVETTLATFELGANGTASHNDGSNASSYTETVNGYKLSISGTFYKNARDAKGNSCVKLGTSKVAGDFTITVPENVTKVTIYIAKYKANTTKITVNGTNYTLTKNSNDGQYDAIVVDTTVTKTVKVATVSGGLRAMVNSIVFDGYAE